MECKLQEQRDLLEKGFREKAELMNQEVQILKEKSKESDNSGNVWTNAVLPVIRQGLETASSIFQYKLFKRFR
uniref:Guanylate-binding protein/Atlastin C-terminal domain-containing protein n=1 Tax=Anguilla anguilla TaxID=7936 RepID=A0A0E9WF70_ANGAN